MEFTIEELKLIEAALITEELRLEEVAKKNKDIPDTYNNVKKKMEKLEKIFDKIDEERRRLFVLNDIENRMEGRK